MARRFAIFTAVALAFAGPAHAGLILNTDVTASFLGNTAWSGTVGNDVEQGPDTVHFGQLQAATDGVIDFFYVGNEAGYTNSLLLGGTTAHSTAGLADTFESALLLGSLDVAAGAFADFGFCTSGGDMLALYGGCVSNADAGSLVAQFNHAGILGYRSIGFRPIEWTEDGGFSWLAPGVVSDLWALFWDDSGAANDDDHDDYVAIARFRPVSVPEPAAALLLGTGLLVVIAKRRRQALAQS